MFAWTAIGLAFGWGSHASGQQRYEYRRVVMGVEARLVLHADDEAQALAAAGAAFDRLDALDATLSDYRVDSELKQVVAAAGGGPIEVSADMLAVLSQAKGLAAATGGAFDPTVAPLVALWRQARATGRLPLAGDLADARALVGHDRLQVDEQAGTVQLRDAGMGLDLGAVAKGWSADQALAELSRAGCPSALVDLGGDLSLGSPPPGRDAWRVSVGCSPRVLPLSDCAVATSGSTVQHLDIDGVRLSHVIDPRSGAALADAPCCSVVARNGATADALASAAMVLGGQAALLLMTAFPSAQVFVDDVAVSLFDGKSLDGWTTTGGRYDGRARWSVEDGAIVGRTAEDGAGGLLYTNDAHTAFDLELDVKLDHPFDSGVFVRMVPPGGGKGAQVTLDDRPGGEIGGVYADGFLAHEPDDVKPWKLDDWNHVRVRCTGFDMHLEAWINGQLVTDHRNARGAEGFAPSGLVGIQVHGGGAEQGHGGVARFRGLSLAPLPVFGAPRDDHFGTWQPQLTKSLEGWDARGLRSREGEEPVPTTGVEGGVVTLFGSLESQAAYRDVALSFELRMPEGGFFLMRLRDVPMGPRWSPTLPILAATDDMGFGPGTPSAVIEPGAWTRVEVLMHDRRLALAIDGQTVFDRTGGGVLVKDVPGPIALSCFAGAELRDVALVGLTRDE